MNDEQGHEPTDEQIDAAGAWHVEYLRESAVTVAAMVGARVRELRHAADVRQEKVAEHARDVGLTWARTSVATLEAGRRDLSIDELILLPLIMSNACGRPVSLGELLPDDAVLSIGPQFILTGSTIKRIVGDTVGENVVSLYPKTDPAPVRDDEAERPRLLRLARLWPDVGIRTLADVARRAGQEADLKAAKKLDVPVEYVAAAAHSLWGRSLTAERDRRAADSGLPDDRLARRTALGNTTRKLLGELEGEVRAAQKRAERAMTGEGDRGTR